MTLYLISNSHNSCGLDIALKDPDASIVLMHDATFLIMKVSELAKESSKICAIHEHAEKCGLLGRIPETIKLVHFEELIDMIAQNKPVCFT